MLHVALADPGRLDEAAAAARGARSGRRCTRSVEGGRLAVACVSAGGGERRRWRRWSRRGSSRRDFSMGSPSLDEVFLALTGKGAEA